MFSNDMFKEKELDLKKYTRAMLKNGKCMIVHENKMRLIIGGISKLVNLVQKSQQIS